MEIPAGLTRMQHYTQLPRQRRGYQRIWTVESAVTALALFVQEEQRFPASEHLNGREGLPSYGTIVKLFQSYNQWKQAYQNIRTPPEPAASPSISYAKSVTCPRCERQWQSPDARHFRICRRCRYEIRDDEDGCWMNGTPVTLGALEESDYMENA